jgi:hypothetical protein
MGEGEAVQFQWLEELTGVSPWERQAQNKRSLLDRSGENRSAGFTVPFRCELNLFVIYLARRLRWAPEDGDIVRAALHRH